MVHILITFILMNHMALIHVCIEERLSDLVILYHFDQMFTIFGKNSPEMANKFSFDLRQIKKIVFSGCDGEHLR